MLAGYVYQHRWYDIASWLQICKSSEVVLDPYINVYNTYGAVSAGNFSTPYRAQPWLMVSYALVILCTFLFIAYHLACSPTEMPCQYSLHLISSQKV